MPTPLNIYLVEKHRKKLAGKKRERVRVKGQESHNRRVGNPPNSPLPLPQIESWAHIRHILTNFIPHWSGLLIYSCPFLYCAVIKSLNLTSPSMIWRPVEWKTFADLGIVYSDYQQMNRHLVPMVHLWWWAIWTKALNTTAPKQAFKRDSQILHYRFFPERFFFLPSFDGNLVCKRVTDQIRGVVLVLKSRPPSLPQSCHQDWRLAL